jgi:hypothetical protein
VVVFPHLTGPQLAPEPFTTRSISTIFSVDVLEAIFRTVKCTDDLYSLTQVNHQFASITCPMYTSRLGIPRNCSAAVIQLKGGAYQALPVWWRSRLFPQNKCLFYDIDHQELELANTQFQALCHFLSTPFATLPFNSIYIFGADLLSLPEILHLMRLID